MSKSKTRWSDQELLDLFEYYPTIPMSELVKKIGRTPAAITRRANSLGITRSVDFWFNQVRHKKGKRSK